MSGAPTDVSLAAGDLGVCAHVERVDGICVACKHCLHELVLNAACYYCGETDLDPVALSNKPVAADALVHIRPRK